MQPTRILSLGALALTLGTALASAQAPTYEIVCTGTFTNEFGDHPGIDVGDEYECRYVFGIGSTSTSLWWLDVVSTEFWLNGVALVITPVQGSSSINAEDPGGDFWAGLQVGSGATNMPSLQVSLPFGSQVQAPLEIDDLVHFEGYYSGGFRIVDALSNQALGDVTLTVTQLSGLDTPPVASAGADFSVNEGQATVPLDGTGSQDADGDALTYAWSQVGAASVLLSGANTAQPTFTAPTVAPGGETLTFELAVTANGVTATDQVNVTVVNVNHPPVADAGDDLSIAEGSPVVLDGSDSFDFDNDSFSYTWTQLSGPTTVALSGAGTSIAGFNAPFFAAGGAPGIVATYEFQLEVTDGMSPDAAAPGFTLDDVTDTVIVEITNLNNAPVANAGLDQTLAENSNVTLDGSASSDPDSDALTYSWTQVAGPAVALTGASTSTPSFAAPFVMAGGADVELELTVSDGYGGIASDTVVVHLQNANDPPLISAAEPTVGLL